MAQGNPVMQKKLAELETEIGRLLEHPSSYIHDDVNGQVGFYQTARKISFIKNLLTAEMDSHSGGGPEYLNHIVMRLSILEKTFVDWAIPASFPVLNEMHVNWVESGDGNGVVNKNSDTSASCSFTESCILDEEEFVEEDNVNQEAKEFGKSDNETILSQVSQVSQVKARGRVESKEEGIEDEVADERSWEKEKEGDQVVEVTKDEKRRDRKHGEAIGKSTREVTEDEKEGRERIQEEKVCESKLDANEDEKGSEKEQESEIVEEGKVVVDEDEEERDKNQEGKTVGEVKVEATEEKGGWKQEREMVGERKFEAEEDKGSERKEGTEMGEHEKEIERNQERQMVGESAVDDEKEGRKEEGKIMGAPMRGRERRPDAEMAVMQKISVKEGVKGRERKQQYYRIKNCLAMMCAAAAGFTIALIGVAVVHIFRVEEMVYLVPT